MSLKGDTINIKTDGIAGLKSSTNYTAEIHSTPVSLGTVTTDSSGKINTNVTIPNTVDPGLHTLHIYGQNVNNEDIDIYQTIYVGDSSTDYDGDSITNSSDPCPMYAQSSTDDDSDGIPDDCDGYINDDPSDIAGLYRARNGIAVDGEDPSKVYIERNVSLGSALLDVNDYDPDSDGWAVIAVSGTLNSSTIASFATTDNGPSEDSYNKYTPKFSIRTSDEGCVQYAPANLDEITSSSSLSMDKIGTDTDTCRTAAPSADINSNSIPDNEETLYRARYGVTANGEDDDKIYVERNVTAAEAILGVSDYDADSDGWAVIAITGSGYTGKLNDLVLIDPSTDTELSSDGKFTSTMLELSREDRRAVTPVVLYRPTIVTCDGLAPDDLTTVLYNQTRGTSAYSLPLGTVCQ